jgi:hypothetical protein
MPKFTAQQKARHDSAVQQLEALVAVPGALKIITNEHHHADGKNLALLAAEPDRCLAHTRKVKRPMLVSKDSDAEETYEETEVEEPISLKDPAHFVHQDVIKIEKYNDEGVYKAISKDGSSTFGYPADLLARLQEHSRA